MKDINAIAKKHFDWVEKMSWHNKSVLEALALIGSEVGEALDEYSFEFNHDAFGEELADIMLRTMDLAVTEGIDVEAAILGGVSSRPVNCTLDRFSSLMVDFGHLVNAARGGIADGDFKRIIGNFMAGVESIARHENIDLEACLHAKIEKNELRGTRGRRI